MDFLRRFRDETSGNILIMFALMLLPILSVVGAAVDYTVKAQEATRLQTALDNVTLALSHEPMAKTDADMNALKDKVNKFLSDNYKTPSGASPKVTKITRNKGSFSIDATATIDTSFMKVADIKTMDISVSSTAVWGSSRVEVVLALDNTGSMSGEKIKQLRLAATNFVNQLASMAYEEGAVKVGLVPFATSVRVNPSDYKTQDWIRFDDIYVRTDRTCTGSGGNQVCTDKNIYRAFNKDIWKGCIQDRDQAADLANGGYDVMDVINPKATDTAQVGYDINDKRTLYPAVETCPQDEQNLQTVFPMVDLYNATNTANLLTAIGNMRAAGNTNVTMGVVWAASMLSSVKPFDQGVTLEDQEKKHVRKIMVVLTDGENTRNRFSSNTSAIDARTRLACTMARDIGTTFTVRVINGSESLLKECATKPTDTDDTTDYYKSVKTANELDGTFGEIVSAISNLRLGS